MRSQCIAYSYTFETVLLQDEVANLKKEGKSYQVAELILQTGESGDLSPGWSKELLTTLEENNFKNISDSIRPSKY